MSRIWTRGFWKDLVERVGSTLVEALIGVMVVAGFSLSDLGEWSIWEPVLVISGLALLKGILAVLGSPTTGASLGTSVPADGVEVLKASTEGSGSHPGDTVAGPGSALVTGTPVEVAVIPFNN